MPAISIELNELLPFYGLFSMGASVLMAAKERGAPIKFVLEPELDMENYDWKYYYDAYSSCYCIEWNEKLEVHDESNV